MSLIDDLIKDKRSLMFEIVLGLAGIGGDLMCIKTVESDVNCINCSVLQTNDSPLNQLLSLSQINLIKQLIIIANNYSSINSFVQKFKSDLNSYNSDLAEGIDRILIHYRNDLIQVEKDINKDPEYSLIKFNKFLKYSQTFDFLNHIITETTEEKVSISSTLDLLNSYSLSGWTEVRKCAKIAHESCGTLCSDIWSWIMYGFLREKSRDNFFIIENEKRDSILDISRLPAFISPIDATKIHQIGETVRSAQRRGDKFIYKGKECELYGLYSKLQLKCSSDKLLFSNFIEKVRSIVSEHSWSYIMNDQKLRDHLSIIKNFYLTGNDNLWSCFVFDSSKIVLNGQNRFQKDIEVAFESSLRQVLRENIAHDMLSTFSITASREGTIPSIFLSYKIPVSLQIILSTDSIDKYNKVLNFMVNLYSARFNLNQIWLQSMKPKLNSMKATSLQMQTWNLRNSMTNIIDNIYYYIKVDVIERLFLNLMEKIEEFKDIEAIQKEHQIFITNITAQTFLKTSVINKCFDELFSICNRFKSCLQSLDLLSQLTQDFKRTIAQLYHLLANIETFKLNPMIANLVSQLELCSKQSTNL